MYPEGAKDIELGKTVAILVENKADVAAFANYSADSASASAPAQPAPQAATPAATPAAASAPATNYPEHIQLEMPNLSPTMEKVR